MTEIQTLLEGEESWRTGALDNAISQILVDLKPHDYEVWKWRFEETFGIELDTALKVMFSSNPNTSVFVVNIQKCEFSQRNLPCVYIPVGVGCPAHRGHRKYAAVVAGSMVCAAEQAVCCVLFSQYSLELVLHVQGKEQTMIFFLLLFHQDLQVCNIQYLLFLSDCFCWSPKEHGEAGRNRWKMHWAEEIWLVWQFERWDIDICLTDYGTSLSIGSNTGHSLDF